MRSAPRRPRLGRSARAARLGCPPLAAPESRGAATANASELEGCQRPGGYAGTLSAAASPCSGRPRSVPHLALGKALPGNLWRCCREFLRLSFFRLPVVSWPAPSLRATSARSRARCPAARRAGPLCAVGASGCKGESAAAQCPPQGQSACGPCPPAPPVSPPQLPEPPGRVLPLLSAKAPSSKEAASALSALLTSAHRAGIGLGFDGLPSVMGPWPFAVPLYKACMLMACNCSLQFGPCQTPC